MRQSESLNNLKPQTREFIIRYRIRKNYPYTERLTIGEIIEILLGSPAGAHDTSLEENLFFDNIIQLGEVKIGWDGEELLDILVYYLDNYIVDRVHKTSAILISESR